MSEPAQRQETSPLRTDDVTGMDPCRAPSRMEPAPVVLIVDDEPSILSALTRLLRKPRYTVLTAEGGEAGLNVLASTPVDLIISDMRMPYMSGADFLARVQARYPDTIRILLTGYSEVESVVRAINEAGIYRYLNKPWDDHDLLTTVAQALEQKRLSREAVQLTALARKQNDELRAFNAGLEAMVLARTEEVQRLARHDPLTGLYNRRVLAAELEAAIAESRVTGCPYLVLIIDLDRFKPVNDLRGHRVGDIVLCEIAERLKDALRRSDTVSRLGGDEFAVIAKADRGSYAESAINLAGRLLAEIRKPVMIDGNRIEIGASIGIASCPSDGSDAEGLLRSADIAMYRAKREARGSFRFFEQRMDEELREQRELEVDVRAAINNGLVLPHYQPLIDIRNNHLYGFEILARWQDPVRGAVPPDIFIPVAEQLGLIPRLTSSLLRHACSDAVRWSNDKIRLSINISTSQLKDIRLPDQLLAILDAESFPPPRLEIEITETALVGDIETAKAVLSALRVAGITVALDDFGTGYSSLYHLRELKFDKVKIDKSFVQSMQSNNESDKIVEAMIGLAKCLGMPAVAEGIEDRASLDHLIFKGCDFGQGFYFGKAMSAEKAKALLTAFEDTSAIVDSKR
ncbi:EAL domain-containing protein [Ralstonia pseudosolanacearum]|uniref:putative bifunctional diguanylate cyclase/phosphodiesterase n=1 Tax=Ralstonia pseudosolanacearum TaxID=1310165 RepID=UPI002676B2B2|nr:EAL domain-containing protein [Ralstonia pseudosolanacearum]MDO3529538.1 EAL domain-containing protein [Ralstonia pseudosolanacearum]MDO3533981.1 EAL domain-containing protein [Ralstonia pseudosolanacearum]MDO3623781.1 EAL domain-containing protein [Ralstonia pseudosolanacearum]